MSTGTPDRPSVWLAIEHGWDSSTVHAVFEHRADAEAYVARVTDAEVQEQSLYGAGDSPEVVTVWTADAFVDVLRRRGDPPELSSKGWRGDSWVPTREPCELVTFEADSDRRLSIRVRGTDRVAVLAKATELYEDWMKAAKR